MPERKQQSTEGVVETESAPQQDELAFGQPMQFSARGPIPTPQQGFLSPGPTASQRAYGDETVQMDAAAKPIASKVPESNPGKKAVPVATDRAPTIDEVFDPQRPSLQGATQDQVLKTIESLVNVMYDKVLDRQLTDLKGKLLRTAPVPETPFALKLLGWVVEQVTAGTLSYMGKFLGKEMFGEAPAAQTTHSIAGTEAAPMVSQTTKSAAPPVQTPKEKAAEKYGDLAGKTAGASLKEKMLSPRPTTAPTAEDTPAPLTTGDLLDEFVERERLMLYGRQSDIMTRLTLTHAPATSTGQAAPEFIALAERLRNLLDSGALAAWFRNKVTMEWLNFVARVSLGPRAEGQTTDLPGANSIDGVAPGDIKARQQWQSGDGMVEITLRVPETVHGTNGVAMQSARIPSSFGAAQILQHLHGAGADGQAYSLATIPVYRRVWLKTGDSKLSEAPAFVITPDGAIEADVANPVLAAIGSERSTHVGESTYMVGSNHLGDEERKDPNAWTRRGADAAHSLHGADLIRAMLQGVSPQVLK